MYLALKEIKNSKLRFTMIGAIIVLIAWLVFILSGLGNGLGTISAASMKNMDTDYVVYEKGAGASFMKSSISGDIKEDLLAADGVDDAALFGQATVAISKGETDNSEEKTDAVILGIEPGSFIEPAVIEGVQLDPDVENGVIADEKLKNEGYKLGDEIVVDGSLITLKIIGFVKGESFNHLPSIFSTVEQWRSYSYAAPGSDNGLPNVVNAIALQGEEMDPAAIDGKMEGIETVTKSQALLGMPGYKAEMGTIYMMLAFLIVISAVVIGVFFYVLTIQKTQQFGVMKAIGASNHFVARSIIAQVFVISLTSIIIGIILTYLTALIFPEGMPFSLNFGMVMIYAIALLIVSVLGSLVCVRRISKVDPLTALGRVE
ncbi:ABC transporter permease [Bacillus tuaregi]|uniref:ABC transporter permease n=1 Tax=Bacillus tuaregi TaxID=1816695 RepID=UPI0008F8BC5C|nr:ABC transporter permease [Bacillus tuaregi]